MSKREKISVVGVVFLSAFFYGSACGQEPPAAPTAETVPPPAAVEQPVVAQPVAVLQQEPAEEKSTVTLDFKDADIQNVLRVLAYKSGVNIVTGKEVVGTVTIRLVDVPWEQALDVILNTYGFAYEREGNIITVSTVDALKERREKKKELTEIEGVTSKVFNLQYLDAQDAKKMLEPQLSPQGKISVLEVTGQKGWKIGVPQAGGQSTDEGKERRERENSRSRSLVVTDTLTYLDRMSKILKEMDVKPVQILIEARIMEVSKNVLRDIGMEWSTGSRLQSHQALTTAGALNGGVPTKFGSDKTRGILSGSNYSQSEPTDPLGYQPSNFNPLATNLNPYNAGLQLLWQKLFGTQMEAMLHALEEDVRTNTLSAPKILTLSGQEAIILIGTKYPIVESSVSGTSGTATENLAYYQDIGVQLYVVPQVSGDEKFINMIVHPVISERTALTVGLNDYPVIDTRETETQILMADGETIVIGGLLRNVKSKSRIGIPILGDIPVIGNLFSRATNNTDKIDLLIFITARVVKPGELTDQEMAMVKQALEAGQANVSPAPEPVKKEKKENKKEKPNVPVAAEGFSKSNRGYLNK